METQKDLFCRSSENEEDQLYTFFMEKVSDYKKNSKTLNILLASLFCKEKVNLLTTLEEQWDIRLKKFIFFHEKGFFPLAETILKQRFDIEEIRSFIKTADTLQTSSSSDVFRFYELKAEQYIWIQAHSFFKAPSPGLYLQKLMAEILSLKLKKRGTVFDLYSADGKFLREIIDLHPLADLTLYGRNSDVFFYQWSKIRNIFEGKDDQIIIKYIRKEMAFQETWVDPHGPLLADAVFCVPVPDEQFVFDMSTQNHDPFTKYGFPPTSSANWGNLLYGLHHLQQTGSGVALLSLPTLFRLNKEEATIRQNLLKAGNLYSIIALPYQMLKCSGIQTCLIVFGKKPVDSILFIDASNAETQNDFLFQQRDLSPQSVEKIFSCFMEASPHINPSAISANLPEKAKLIATTELLKDPHASLNVFFEEKSAQKETQNKNKPLKIK